LSAESWRTRWNYYTRSTELMSKGGSLWF